ncbi:hypothetical protein AvCA_44560 [Azotobacter vinelandii CA]|uniref:Uncharacterized protein n=2 Tax=Azotobacter vinelandii TaxID=354 RepID=C1DGS8_AZOVD|nr:hypothetical protein Avin_44560 [Azotobacter vinelandii DJ]AGK15941.1 hypothetical protein AvCA_44560 [Azotobacter vinelandii CA]AGK22024.1 hypothetical protein AvCA6_44560 [Azotobacter vinelandii CA6]
MCSTSGAARFGAVGAVRCGDSRSGTAATFPKISGRFEKYHLNQLFIFIFRLWNGSC